jgi:hypothetical protein
MEITHENIKIFKKGNYWRCPNDCHDKRYPKPKWKTEKAFKRHLDNCHLMPSKIKDAKKKESEKSQLLDYRLKEIERLKQDFLLNVGIKIGKEVTYIREIIVKPTHVNRNGRMVKVRYEPVLKHEAITEVVNTISFNKPTRDITIDEMKNLLVINNSISFYSLTEKEKAIEEADQKTKSDFEHRRVSSLFR